MPASAHALSLWTPSRIRSWNTTIGSRSPWRLMSAMRVLKSSSDIGGNSDAYSCGCSGSSLVLIVASPHHAVWWVQMFAAVLGIVPGMAASDSGEAMEAGRQRLAGLLPRLINPHPLGPDLTIGVVVGACHHAPPDVSAVLLPDVAAM